MTNVEIQFFYVAILKQIEKLDSSKKNKYLQQHNIPIALKKEQTCSILYLSALTSSSKGHFF